MPLVILKTGIVGPDGQEEVLREYFCDWPDCRNVAAHVVGVAKEIGACAVICDEHAVVLSKKNSQTS